MKRDVWTILGLFVVGAAAAVLSFSALRELAILCGIPSELAWLFPLTIDLFAAIASRVWLRADAGPDAVRFARLCTWVAIVVGTIGGNAAHGVLAAYALVPPWWAVVAVSATPAVALGALVHLAGLVGRTPARGPAGTSAAGSRSTSRSPAPAPAEPPAELPAAPSVLSLAPAALTLAPDLAGHVERARELIEQHAARGERLGRGRLAELLGVREHEARELLRVLAPINGRTLTRS